MQLSNIEGDNVMKRTISILSIAIILFLSVGCQGQDSSGIKGLTTKTFLEKYNVKVVEMSQVAGIKPIDLLTLEENPDVSKDTDIVKHAVYRGAKSHHVSGDISKTAISVNVSIPAKENLTTQEKNIVTTMITAAIEVVTPSKGLEIEREMNLLDNENIFRMPESAELDENGVMILKKDGMNYLFQVIDDRKFDESFKQPLNDERLLINFAMSIVD